MTANIGINDKNLTDITNILSAILANEMVLYVKTRKAHWNVIGESFMEFHKLFETQYKELEESIDQVAERIGKLGHKTMGTMHEFLAHSSIKESAGKYPETKLLLQELLDDHEMIIINLREKINTCSSNFQDHGTVDFLTGLIQQHETAAWVLRRYLA
jgi:starvation-inducible DNA-binding protein